MCACWLGLWEAAGNTQTTLASADMAVILRQSATHTRIQLCSLQQPKKKFFVFFLRGPFTCTCAREYAIPGCSATRALKVPCAVLLSGNGSGGECDKNISKSLVMRAHCEDDKIQREWTEIKVMSHVFNFLYVCCHNIFIVSVDIIKTLHTVSGLRHFLYINGCVWH